MSELPEPLVPAEVDLRDFPDFPLDFKRLFASDTWIMCDAEEKVAALRLWCMSMHQEPAGSLPDNDRILADLAGYGVAVREFLKVKENAMRGWIRCADGRLYHHVVAEKVLDCWAKKRRKAVENAADRERKRRKKEALSGRNASRVPPENGGGPPDVPPEFRPENVLSRRGSRRESPSDAYASSGFPPEGPPTADPPEDPDLLPIEVDRTDVGEAVRAWNELAARCDLASVQKLTDARRRKLAARLRDCGGLAGWRAALGKVEASRFLRGENDRGWRADFDFMLQESSFVKLMEGKYDDRNPQPAGKRYENGFAQLIAEGRV